MDLHQLGTSLITTAIGAAAKKFPGMLLTGSSVDSIIAFAVNDANVQASLLLFLFCGSDYSTSQCFYGENKHRVYLYLIQLLKTTPEIATYHANDKAWGKLLTALEKRLLTALLVTERPPLAGANILEIRKVFLSLKALNTAGYKSLYEKVNSTGMDAVSKAAHATIAHVKKRKDVIVANMESPTSSAANLLQLNADRYKHRRFERFTRIFDTFLRYLTRAPKSKEWILISLI